MTNGQPTAPAQLPSLEQIQQLLSSPEALAAYLGTGAGGQTAYDQAKAEFAAPISSPAIQRAYMQHGVGYIESETGKLLYANGVMVDLASKNLIPGPWMTDPNVEGSAAWLNEVQNNGDKWANKWRKTLWDQGYTGAGMLQSESGGMAQDLLDALQAYHFSRYVNYGKAQPLAPTNQKTREAIREQVDFVTLKEEMKTWGVPAFGEELDDDSADYLAERMVRKMTQLAKKHPTWTFEQIETGADVRVQQEFVEEPEVKEGLREAKRIEERTGLRDKLETAAQVFGSL